MSRWLAMCLLLVSSAATGEARIPLGGTMQVALDAQPTDLSPYSPLVADQEVATLMFDSLFRIDGAKAVPHVALELAVLGDTKVRIRLRPDVRFHDGTVVRPEDVVASLSRARHSRMGWLLGAIRGERVVGAEVELELVRPTPELAWLLATPAAAVLPERVDPAKPVGTGPFKLAERSATQIRLKPHLEHFAGRPYLDELVMRTFATRTEETGTFQVGELSVARHTSSKAPRATLATSEKVQTVYLAFGNDFPNDPALRTAVVQSLGRERMLKHALRDPAEVAQGLAPSVWGGKKSLVSPAVTRPLGDRLPSVKLLIDRSRIDDKVLADFVLADLSRVGVEVTVEPVEASEYRQRLQSGTYGLLLGVSVPPAATAVLSSAALTALVDPERATTSVRDGAKEQSESRIAPLFFRGVRLGAAGRVGGLTLDFAGRARFADVYLLRSEKP